MKTILILVILCCNTQKDDVYQYETKNLKTNQTGDLYCQSKYNVGDTVIIK
jgi:hypothetical protein